jgi:phage baseplate assembly protein W
MAEYYGMNPPFIGGTQNILSRQEDDRLIKNDILQLLLTVPGDRVMRPDFGVNLRNAVFEQMTDNDLSILENEIRRSIETQDPRVIVNNVSLARDDDSNNLQIIVIFSIKKDPRRQLTIQRFINQGTGSDR